MHILGLYFVVAGRGFDAKRFHDDSAAVGIWGGHCLQLDPRANEWPQELRGPGIRRFVNELGGESDEPIQVWVSGIVEPAEEAENFDSYADVLVGAVGDTTKDTVTDFIERLQRSLPDVSPYASEPPAAVLRIVGASAAGSNHAPVFLTAGVISALARLHAGFTIDPDQSALLLLQMQQDA